MLLAVCCQRVCRYRGALPWSAWYTLRVPVITVGAAHFIRFTHV